MKIAHFYIILTLSLLYFVSGAAYAQSSNCNDPATSCGTPSPPLDNSGWSGLPDQKPQTPPSFNPYDSNTPGSYGAVARHKADCQTRINNVETDYSTCKTQATGWADNQANIYCPSLSGENYNKCMAGISYGTTNRMQICDDNKLQTVTAIRRECADLGLTLP